VRRSLQYGKTTQTVRVYGLEVMEASLEKAQSELGVDRDTAAEHRLEAFFADD
jgi:hypothetical protein